MALSDKERDQSRVRTERYRSGKTQVTFATTPDVKEALVAMAKKYGYKTIREFMEALAKGHASLEQQEK